MPEPSKADLIAEAEGMGLEVSESMTKSEIQAEIDQARQSQTDETADPVCVQCGQPAAWKTTNPAVNSVFYCQEHGAVAGEAMDRLAGPTVEDAPTE